MEYKSSKTENKAIFKLKEKDTIYTLSFEVQNSSLVISIIDDDSVPLIRYTGKFSLNELEKQSRYFKLFESLDQFIPELKDLFEQNKISFKKERLK